jgi:trimeric autotransporter adhesin
MARFTPTDIVSQYSAIAALNANFDTLATLLELCLFRDGTSPNQMLTNLNMNNFKVQNVANGTASADAVNLGQLQSAVLGSLANVSLTGTLTVAGVTTLAGVNASSLLVSGAMSAGSITTTGTAALGHTTVTGNLTATGDTVFGTNASNVHTFNAGTVYVTNPTTTVQFALEPVAGTTSVIYLKGAAGSITDGLTLMGGSGTGVYRATSHIFRDPANTDTFATLTTAGLNLGSGNVLSINSQQVVGARGAALPADATDLASVIALANAIKARLKTTGGHGLVAD